MRNYQLSQEKIARIIESVNENFDKQLDFLIELVNMPSLRGQEATAQDLMAQSFRKEGLVVDRWQINLDDIRHLPGFSPVHQSYDNAWNVVGVHRPDNPRGRSLILNGHIDVVPTGPLDMWTRPPFDAYIEDGWLYGRGAGDMKAGLSCNLFALKALHKLGYQPAANLYMQSVVEEECTGNGTLACLQRGYRAEVALISEPHDDMLGRAQMGVIWLQVELKGRPAHAAFAGTGFNAIEATFPYISALKMLEEKWNSEKHPEYAHCEHPINFVLSKIEGGDWTSSVPSWCTFDIRMSIYPGTTVAEAQEEIEAVIAEVTSRNAYLTQNPPKLTYHGFLAEGYVLERGSDAEAVLRAIHEDVYQQPIEEMVSTATNDSKFFGLYQNIPAIVYGPLCQNDHGFDERVNVESVRKITQTLALFIATWCGLEKMS